MRHRNRWVIDLGEPLGTCRAARACCPCRNFRQGFFSASAAFPDRRRSRRNHAPPGTNESPLRRSQPIRSLGRLDMDSDLLRMASASFRRRRFVCRHLAGRRMIWRMRIVCTAAHFHPRCARRATSAVGRGLPAEPADAFFRVRGGAGGGCSAILVLRSGLLCGRKAAGTPADDAAFARRYPAGPSQKSSNWSVS